MSIIDDLLAIKSFRESQAEIAMLTRREQLARANAEEEAAKTLLARIERAGNDTERSLYQELCTHVVKLRDIEDVQQTVAQLRQREADQKDAVAKATDAQESANREFSTAREVHQQAMKQKSKFLDLADVFAVDEQRERERKEDLEMEEVANLAREREDWGSGAQDLKIDGEEMASESDAAF